MATAGVIEWQSISPASQWMPYLQRKQTRQQKILKIENNKCVGEKETGAGQTRMEEWEERDTKAIQKVDDELKCVVNKRMNKEQRERERERERERDRRGEEIDEERNDENAT